MERLNWAVLGLMGIVTALGLSTSSGAGKAKSADSDVEVVACAPLAGTAPTSDATPIELAANVPAATHSHAGCSACQAHNAAGHEPAGSKAFDELVALIQSSVKPSTGHMHASDCPGNCPETGVCCDKSLKKEGVVSVDRSGETYDVPNGGLRKSGASPLIIDLDKVHCEGDCPLNKKAATDVAATDCPLAKAADALANLTKNFVCEGGECKPLDGRTVLGKVWTLTPDCCLSKDHGTLTITAVEPAAKSEGLLNLQAAAEVAAASHEPAKSEVGPGASTITISSDGLTKAGSGTLTLNIKAENAQPAAAATTLVEQLKAAEAKPVIDNSRAAARAAKLAKIEAKMEEPWTLEIDKITLAELADAVQQKYGVPVLLDRSALKGADIEPQQVRLNPVKQPEIETGAYLQGLLNEQNLTWIVPATNDRVLITTTERAAQSQLTRVFDVSGLVDENQVNEELLEKITQFVETSTWARNGGQGQVALLKKGNQVKLVATNDYWTLRRLTEYLEDLRAGLDEQPARSAQIDPRVPVLRAYDLNVVFSTDTKVAERNQKLNTLKLSLQQVLKSTAGFSEDTFEALEFGNRTVLMTKQLPAVHKEIERLFETLNQNQGFGGALGSMIPVVGGTQQYSGASGKRFGGGFFSVAP